MNNKLTATFICMFDEPIKSYLNSSIIGRAENKGVLKTHIESILKHMEYNHHKIDDTPYGGGPGELIKIDVVAPLIKKSLSQNNTTVRKNKRVILLDPSGQKFDQSHANRLKDYAELIFVCGRYEGIDARIHHYVDEALSVGDFILSQGDLPALCIFDATARLIEGVLGNKDSITNESHKAGRLEASHYTRPLCYEDHRVPSILTSGNHKLIDDERRLESIYKTKLLRPDLIKAHPLTKNEEKLLKTNKLQNYPWLHHD